MRPFPADAALKKALFRSALLREIIEHRVIFKLDLLPDAAVPVFQNHGLNLPGILLFRLRRVEGRLARAAKLQANQHVAGILDCAGFLERLHADALAVAHAVQAGDGDHGQLEIAADALELQHRLVHVLLVRRPLVVGRDDLQIVHDHQRGFAGHVDVAGDALADGRHADVAHALGDEQMPGVFPVARHRVADNLALPLAILRVAAAVRHASGRLGAGRAPLARQREGQRVARNRLGHQLGARHLQREDEHVLPAGGDLVADLRHQRRLAQRGNRADDVQPLVQPAVQRPIQRVKPRGQARRVDAFGDANQLDKAYEWYADLGIHSVKTGYAGGLPNGHNHHGQFNVRHYRNVVKTAAKYRTTLDVHEPIKDTGIRRTYPNMMTREGARGMEWNAWSEGNPPEHHVMLPFTRLLGGPMDYTPGIFDVLYKRAKNNPDRKKWNMKDSKDCRINTTLAKQIANWVILYSPLQMAADMIENYEGHPAFRFFRDFDADCDWSEALAGEPGEYVAIVRKAKDKYFLGAATDEEARSIDVKLDFLEKGKTYAAVIYADGKDADWETNPESYEIIEKQVTSDDTLTIVMAKGGGQAVSFMPI